MKRSSRKLALHRDTLRTLGAPALQEANGGSIDHISYTCTLVVSCAGTCVTHCGCFSQPNCSIYC